jgi:hypothetical protein
MISALCGDIHHVTSGYDAAVARVSRGCALRVEVTRQEGEFPGLHAGSLWVRNVQVAKLLANRGTPRSYVSLRSSGQRSECQLQFLTGVKDLTFPDEGNMMKQEVMGRTNRMFPSVRHGPHSTRPTILLL